MAASSMMTLQVGSGVTAAATANQQLSSSAAVTGSSKVLQQQLAVVRPSAKASKIVAATAGSDDDEKSFGSSKKGRVLAALAAAGAALVLTAVPVAPADAAMFRGGKVEGGATGTESTGPPRVGDKVASARGAGSSGTPLGEAKGSKSGTNTVTAQVAKDAVEPGIDINIDPLKTKISDIDPFQDTLKSPESDAK